MSKQDVRKEQIALLRFEQKLIEAAEQLSALENMALSADSKMQTNLGSKAFPKMKSALQRLANITGSTHDSLMDSAVSSDSRILTDKFFESRHVSNGSLPVQGTVDAHIKPRVKDVVLGKLAPNADAHIKPRVKDVVQETLTPSHGNNLRSKLIES